MAGKKEKEEKKNWYVDRYQYVVVQRNILAVITVVSLLGALAAAFSISQLAPLKSVEPFVIQVDQKSGITQVVKPQTARDLLANEAVNNYFLVQYIRARESWGIANVQNYNIVRVMSEPYVFRAYAALVSPNNEQSPRNTLGDRGVRRIKVGTITPLNYSQATAETNSVLRYQVRILVQDEVPDRQPQSYYRLVTMEFKYANLDLTAEDRYLNPLGFRVVGYRIDEDALTR